MSKTGEQGQPGEKGSLEKNKYLHFKTLPWFVDSGVDHTLHIRCPEIILRHFLTLRSFRTHVFPPWKTKGEIVRKLSPVQFFKIFILHLT